MGESPVRDILVSIRARRDDAFSDRLFVSLRLYELDTDDPPADSAEVTSVEEALTVLEDWLNSIARGSP